jgi:hypothetical protein
MILDNNFIKRISTIIQMTYLSIFASVFGKMIKMISDIYERFINIADNYGLIDHIFELANVELISVILNDSEDITKQFQNNFGECVSEGKYVHVSDVIQSQNFESIEITVMINLCMFSFVHTNIKDVLYFQYGIEWPKFIDYSDDLYRMRYLDLAIE